AGWPPSSPPTCRPIPPARSSRSTAAGRAAARRSNGARPGSAKTDQRKGNAQQSKARRLGDKVYRGEQAVRLAIDPVREEKSVWVAVVAGISENKRPEPAWCIAEADVDRDRAVERSGERVEGVDLAGVKAEIADQQIAAERAKT